MFEVAGNIQHFLANELITSYVNYMIMHIDCGQFKTMRYGYVRRDSTFLTTVD